MKNVTAMESLMMKLKAQKFAQKRIRANFLSFGLYRNSMNIEKIISHKKLGKNLLNIKPFKRIWETITVAVVLSRRAFDSIDLINGTSNYVNCGMSLYPRFLKAG